MSYRDMAVEIVKITGQELIDRAEELIPYADGVRDIDIWIRIPTSSGDGFEIPEIQVDTNVYPKHRAIEKIAKLLSEVKP